MRNLNLNNPDVLDDIEKLISSMSDAEKAEIDQLIQPELSKPWQPNPGPQTMAYESKADIILYGGAAGGGKTDLMIGLAVNEHKSSAIFRREGVELDGIVERSKEILENIGRYNGQDSVWSLPNRARIKFGGMREVKDWRKFAGRARDFMGFDEAGEFAEEQIASIKAWLRSVDPDQHCRLLLTSNPPRGGEGDWMIEWFAPWLDPMHPNPAEPGELRWAIIVTEAGVTETVWCDNGEPREINGEEYFPKTRTFVPALLDDNPYLRHDKHYRGTLQSLPEPLRSQLLYGDFLAGREDHDYQVIPTEWVELAIARWKDIPPSGRIMLSIATDVAQGGKDNTVVSKLFAPAWFDNLVVKPGIDTKDGTAVGSLIVSEMRDGALIGIDMTGGWGGAAKLHLENQGLYCQGIVASEGSGLRTKDQALAFFTKRSELWWRFREALDPKSGENIALPPDKRLKAELTTVRWKLKPGRPASGIRGFILVEAKDDIRKRIGASTDRADAVLMSWSLRDRGMLKQRTKDQDTTQSVPEDSPFADL